MVYFQTKNTNLGKFWRTLDWKMLLCLEYFGIFHDHMENFMFSWYIFSGLGIMCQEKSGNPGRNGFRRPVVTNES
jgi:hypothetical protein